MKEQSAINNDVCNIQYFVASDGTAFLAKSKTNIFNGHCQANAITNLMKAEIIG